MFIHKLEKGWKYPDGRIGQHDRIDVWNVDETTGNKSTWQGALILNYRGQIREVGEVPPELRRNLVLILTDGKTSFDQSLDN